MPLDHDLLSAKGDKKKQTVMVLGTVALVVLAYLTLRKMSGGGTAPVANGGSAPATVGAAGGGPSADMTGMQYSLDQIAGQLSQLSQQTRTGIPAGETPTIIPAPTPTPKTIQTPESKPQGTRPTPQGAKKTTNHTATVGSANATVGQIMGRWFSNTTGKAMTLAQFRALNPTQSKAGTGTHVAKGTVENVTGFHLKNPTPPSKPAHPATHG